MCSWQTWLRTLSGVVIFALCAASGQAQQYIFTNDNVSGGANTTTSLLVQAKGVVKVVKAYPTGGKSAGSAYFALEPITFAHTRAGYCVFASNGGDNTVSAFQANLFDGTLKAVKLSLIHI